MKMRVLGFVVSLALIYRIHAAETDANQVIHSIYTIARDYRNARIADVNILPKADKLVLRISEISRIIESRIRSKEDESEAWKGVQQELFSGFLLLLNSCETKNAKGYLLGSIKISSSLVAVTGIQGALDSVILEATGHLFEIFGSIFDGKHPTKGAFREFRDNGVDLDFREAKFYFDNLLNPVVLNPKTDVLLETISEKEIADEKCCQYSEDEAIEILRMNQKPLYLYAKMSSLMMTYCKNEVIQSSQDALGRCLTVIKQYCEISKTHQAFLLRVMSAMKISNLTDNMLYAHKLLYHVKKLFRRDKVTLDFLFNPMKAYHASKVLYEVHLRKTEFKDVLDHMAVLHDKYSLYDKQAIVLCRQTELKGLCHLLKPTIEISFQGKFWKFQTLKDWTEARSMFVPPRFQVEFMMSEIDVARNRPHSYHGPFKGLAVYSSEQPFDLRSIRISIEHENQDDPQTRICTDIGWCDTFSDDTKSFKSIHGIDISQNLLTSIEIPEGIFVKLLTADGSIIPLVGPFSTTDLDKCKVWSWSQIVQIKKIVLASNSATTADVLNEVFSPTEENLSSDDDVLKGSEIQVSTKMKRFTESDIAKEERSDMMVVVCTRPYLKGFCVQYGSDYAIRGMFSTFQKLFQTECKLGMQSLLIPAGIKVIGFQKINGKFSAFGPYIGPIVIDKLDYGAEYQIEVLNSFKNTKTVNSALKPRYRTNKSKKFVSNGINLRTVNSIYDYF